MCGICAVFGKENVVPLVLGGLELLQYRGYDSSGLAYFCDGELKVCKAVGGVENLKKMVNTLSSNVVIGHTRWATHGMVTKENAHPQVSQHGKIAMVHNGIIENYNTLKGELEDVIFVSQTDTEVFVNLIAKESGTLLEKTVKCARKIVGTFAVALMSEEEKKIVVAKRESPLYIAKIDGAVMATSDILLFSEKAENYYTLLDDEYAMFDNEKIEFYNKNGEKIIKKPQKMQKISKKTDFFEKYHMKSEILETKNALKNTLENYLNGEIFNKIKLPQKLKRVEFIACGTAFHSALVGAHYLKKVGIEANANIASEFRYGDEIMSENVLYVLVSQSGETADTIACAKMLKGKNANLLALTNSAGCYLNSICENVLPTFAGREIAVASTKAYSCQVFVLYLFSLFLSKKLDKNIEKLEFFVKNLNFNEISDEIVDKVLSFDKVFFVGRQLDFVSSCEASLKLKEIAYINSLAIASGELKHGTLALVDEKCLVIAICTQSKIKEKLLSNLEEIKSRGAKVLLVTQFEDIDEYDKVDLQNFDEDLMPIVSIIPLQFLAFKVALKLGYSPDKPKNLAKSVTVE